MTQEQLVKALGDAFIRDVLAGMESARRDERAEAAATVLALWKLATGEEWGQMGRERAASVSDEMAALHDQVAKIVGK
jgi:hypothetical protein